MELSVASIIQQREETYVGKSAAVFITNLTFMAILGTEFMELIWSIT
jgi:hypothetical protein